MSCVKPRDFQVMPSLAKKGSASTETEGSLGDVGRGLREEWSLDALATEEKGDKLGYGERW